MYISGRIEKKYGFFFLPERNLKISLLVAKNGHAKSMLKRCRGVLCRRDNIRAFFYKKKEGGAKYESQMKIYFYFFGLC